MQNVYLWIVGENILRHSDLDAAAELDGLTRQPDITVAEKDFLAAKDLVRLINGEIVLGKTPEEKTAEITQKRITKIDAEILSVEQRLVRPILAHTLGTGNAEDISKLNELSAQIINLRAERQGLATSLDLNQN